MPAHPVVEIEVSGDAVTVDGVVVDRGSAGGPDTTVAMHLGVHAAARQVAQPLGRPVRAVLRWGDDEKRLVIHPDGAVTDVEDTFPVTSLLAPAGSRAAPIPITRHARRPAKAPLRVQRTRIAVGVAYAAIAAVLAGGVLMELAKSDDQTPEATSENEPPPLTQPQVDEPATPAEQAVIAGNRLKLLPGIRDVVVNPDTDGFQLRLTTGRAARVTVRAAAVSGDGGAWQWALQTAKATTRTLDVDDLVAGAYRWEVRAPGERPVTGSFVVEPPVEPPTVVTVDTTPDETPVPPPANDPPPADNDGGGGNGGNGGGDDGSSLPGPTEPIDPDDPQAR
ncbi:MAG TPA: hypothetical protein VFO49_15805 [Nocardioides sp.]|nr:hypothetical protein [Nocardioides sp.]